MLASDEFQFYLDLFVTINVMGALCNRYSLPIIEHAFFFKNADQIASKSKVSIINFCSQKCLFPISVFNKIDK